MEAKNIASELENLEMEEEENEETGLDFYFLDLLSIINLLNQSNIETVFPNVSKLIPLALTFGLTSDTSERSLSLMRILKTALRSILGQDRFNSLAVIKMKWDIEVDIQNVINVFAANKNRKFELLFD